MTAPVALALLALVGLFATKLPRLSAPSSPTLQLLVTSGLPLLLVGLLLARGIGVLDRQTLAALAPVTVLVVGWVGARLGARWEWRQHPSGSCEAAGQDSARGGAGWGEEIRRVLRRPVRFQKSRTITGGR